MDINTQEIDSLLALATQQDDAGLIAMLQDLRGHACVERVLWSYTNILTAAAGANALAAAAVSAPVGTQIDASAMFLWISTCYFATTANAAQGANTRVVPLVTVLIVDQGSGRQLMDNPVPVDSIAGNGQFPYVLPEPRLIAANSTIQFTYTNFDAAAGYNIRMTLNGYKIYKLEA